MDRIPEPYRPPDPNAALRDPKRLAAVAATGLSSTADEILDGYCRLVRRVLKTPTALVTLVESGRQLLPGVVGLGGQAEELRETPISHSLCQTVVAGSQPLVLPDTRAEPSFRDHPAVLDLNIGAYAGMPLTSTDGQVLGALCAIDSRSHDWSTEDLETLADIAVAVSSELRLRATNAHTQQLLLEAAQATARAELVASVSDVLANRFDQLDGLAELARAVVPVLADWCAVDALDGDRLFRVEVGHRELDLPAGVRRRDLPPIVAATAPLARVLRGLEPLVRLSRADLAGIDRRDDLGNVQAQLFEQLGAGDALVLALAARGRVFGAMTLVRTGVWGFSIEEELTALDLARRASLAIDNSRLYALQRGAAETLQAGLLTQLPTLHGATLAGRYVPASEAAEVGGDWYDAFRTSGGGAALVIGDVVGHDLAAAAKMGQLRNLLRAVAVDRGGDPAAALVRLDALVDELAVDVLATRVGAGVRTGEDGNVRLRWSNAGHPPPVLIAPDGTASLLTGGRSDGLMLGADPTVERDAAEIVLEPGSTVLLYTDGLVERRDVAIDGRLELLRTVVASYATAAVEALLDGVLHDMVGSAHDDDVALLAFRLG
jgi:serine phosphatase RsbU (regulator of sigma subunit)